MKIHRFECENKHIFFVPLHLPQDLTVTIDIFKKLKCPLCDSKDLKMAAQEFTVH